MWVGPWGFGDGWPCGFGSLLWPQAYGPPRNSPLKPPKTPHRSAKPAPKPFEQRPLPPRKPPQNHRKPPPKAAPKSRPLKAAPPQNPPAPWRQVPYTAPPRGRAHPGGWGLPRRRGRGALPLGRGRGAGRGGGGDALRGAARFWGLGLGLGLRLGYGGLGLRSWAGRRLGIGDWGCGGGLGCSGDPQRLRPPLGQQAPPALNGDLAWPDGAPLLACWGIWGVGCWGFAFGGCQRPHAGGPPMRAPAPTHPLTALRWALA